MDVKLYDAINGVLKMIKNVKSVVLYRDRIICTDNHDTDYIIPESEFDKYCVHVSESNEDINNDQTHPIRDTQNGLSVTIYSDVWHSNHALWSVVANTIN